MAPERETDPFDNLDVPAWVLWAAVGFALLTAFATAAGCWWVGVEMIDAIRVAGPAE